MIGKKEVEFLTGNKLNEFLMQTDMDSDANRYGLSAYICPIKLQSLCAKFKLFAIKGAQN